MHECILKFSAQVVTALYELRMLQLDPTHVLCCTHCYSMFPLRSLLLLLAIVSSGVGLPLWNDSRRTHAHTGLRIDAFCNVTRRTCMPVFENVADFLNELNITAFVRHSKSGDEERGGPQQRDPGKAGTPLFKQRVEIFPRNLSRRLTLTTKKLYCIIGLSRARITCTRAI